MASQPPPKRRRGPTLAPLAVGLLAVALAGCETLTGFGAPGGPPTAAPVEPPAILWQEYPVVTTGYCPCEKCCDWKRDWLGRPVFTSGPNRGQTKVIGQTASGVMARRGTVASDPKCLPYGTHLFVPGYGYGAVEDCGGAIKGRRLDLFFPTHDEALRWGRRVVMIRVLTRPWLGLRPPPPGQPPTPAGAP